MQNYYSYSKTGSAHIADGICNQDAVLTASANGISLAVLADGVSSCENSRTGAEYVCGLIRDIMLTEADFYMSLKSKSIAGLIVGFVRDELKKLADGAGEEPVSYASTLCFVCIDSRRGKTLVFSLGDSRIYAVGSDSGTAALGREYEIAGCATMTDGVQHKVYAEVFPSEKFDSFMLCSDGAWRLMTASEAIESKLQEDIAAEDVRSIYEFFDSADNQDDCSYCFIGTNQL